MSANLSLTVIDRRQESEDVVSLYLAASDGSTLPAFLAGQHLPLRLNLPQRAVATYTISSPPHQRSHYRISIKRETSGKGGSTFLHDQAPVGTVLQAAAPRGQFVVSDAEKPLLFLTGGVGITPALSMISERLAQGTPERPVIFIHAANSPAHSSFAAELDALAAAHPMIKFITLHAQGGTTRRWQAGQVALAQGFVTRSLLQEHVPLDDYDSYLCGPPAFMTAMRAILRDLGRPDSSIKQENFGEIPRTAEAPAPMAAPKAAAASAPLVKFARSGVTAAWQDSENLLEFAEAQGLTPEFSCRAGVCGSCSCKLEDGAVDYVIEPLDPPESGHVLLCCVKPKGSITLAI